MKYRVLFILTHPIQYYSPIFKMLSCYDDIELKVIYTAGDLGLENSDLEFNRKVNWDIPLLEGYDYEYCNNLAYSPGSHSFWGIVCSDLNIKVDKFNPHLVCLIGWNYFSHLKFILRNRFKKYLLTFRGDSHLLDKQNVIKKIIKNALLKFLYRKIDYFFYVGLKNRDYFLSYKVPETKLYYVNHAVDNERFALIINNDLDELRRKYGIKSTDKVILFVGKLIYKKGIDTLVNAFTMLTNNLKDEQNKYKLLIVGDGELSEYIMQLDNQNIIFAGFINQQDLPNYYKISNLLVLPSRGPGETWGLVVNEAMANGLGIITSNKVGSAYDLVEDNKNGFIIESENENQLLEALNKAFDGERYIKFGIESLRIIENHSTIMCAERYIMAFRSILNEK